MSNNLNFLSNCYVASKKRTNREIDNETNRHIDTNKHFFLMKKTVNRCIIIVNCYCAYYIFSKYHERIEIMICQQIIAEHSEYHLRYHVNLFFLCIFNVFRYRCLY